MIIGKTSAERSYLHGDLVNLLQAPNDFFVSARPSYSALCVDFSRMAGCAADPETCLLWPFPPLTRPRNLTAAATPLTMVFCSHDSCRRKRAFNFEGEKAAYCRYHAMIGMVDVISKSCSHVSCTRRPSFNFEGHKLAEYCKQHAEDGMVNVISRRCLRDTCTSQPTFNDKGSKMAKYCKRHADDGMVDVRSKVCALDSCSMQPGWGLLTNDAPTACLRHKSDIVGGPVINFKARCKVERYTKASRWGLHGKQPTHCCDHGPFNNGLVRTVGAARRKRGSRPCRVKTECFF